MDRSLSVSSPFPHGGFFVTVVALCFSKYRVSDKLFSVALVLLCSFSSYLLFYCKLDKEGSLPWSVRDVYSALVYRFQSHGYWSWNKGAASEGRGMLALARGAQPWFSGILLQSKCGAFAKAEQAWLLSCPAPSPVLVLALPAQQGLSLGFCPIWLSTAGPCPGLACGKTAESCTSSACLSSCTSTVSRRLGPGPLSLAELPLSPWRAPLGEEWARSLPTCFPVIGTAPGPALAGAHLCCSGFSLLHFEVFFPLWTFPISTFFLKQLTCF